jgi:hypothetical protein
MALVGLFAIFHGHAHGAEMPPDVSGTAYASGFHAGDGAAALCRHRARPPWQPGWANAAGASRGPPAAQWRSSVSQSLPVWPDGLTFTDSVIIPAVTAIGGSRFRYQSPDPPGGAMQADLRLLVARVRALPPS